MRLGAKRKTFSEYVCAVARSTAFLASTTSIEPPLRRFLDVGSGMAWRDKRRTDRRKDQFYTNTNLAEFICKMITNVTNPIATALRPLGLAADWHWCRIQLRVHSGGITVEIWHKKGYNNLWQLMLEFIWIKLNLAHRRRNNLSLLLVQISTVPRPENHPKHNG